MSEIAIIGAGAWGTALSIVLGREETHRIRLWAHETEVCESITQRRINEKFLPGQIIPGGVTACSDLTETLEGAPIVVSVMPSQHCRRLFERMRPQLRPETMIVSATKGLEETSLLRMTEVITQVVEGDGKPALRIGAHGNHDCFAGCGSGAHHPAGIQPCQLSRLYQ
jgi:glycerol-3-phosphate dehydrogenase (NAD(P)+)